MAAKAAGFTLAEMLAALAILLFGVTALIGSLATSVAQRRTTDARHELTALCDHAMHRVVHECPRATEGDNTPLGLSFVPLLDQAAAGFDGVRWFDAGDAVDAVFYRVIPRQLPLGARVVAFRGDPTETETPKTVGK
jgi:prepilin-type N-terminal cleavage/methylation domain-containing protein